MHLLTVSGFLGSGKTTFILKLAEAAVQRNFKVAILVNEIGDIGIDNQLMRQLDLNVWQLLAGCICCSLRKDLPGTLQKLVDDYSPDLVLLEPSGAANLQKVLFTLFNQQGTPIVSHRTVVIVDPLRLEKLITVLTPLINSQIDHADLVLINKIDVAKDEELKNSAKIISNFKNNGKVFCMSAKETIEPALLMELLP